MIILIVSAVPLIHIRMQIQQIHQIKNVFYVIQLLQIAQHA